MQDILENTSRERLNDELLHVSKRFATSEGSFHRNFFLPVKLFIDSLLLSKNCLGRCMPHTGLPWMRIHQKVNYKSKINLPKKISFSNVALTGLNGSSLVMNMVLKVWIPLGNEYVFLFEIYWVPSTFQLTIWSNLILRQTVLVFISPVPFSFAFLERDEFSSVGKHESTSMLSSSLVTETTLSEVLSGFKVTLSLRV